MAGETVATPPTMAPAPGATDPSAQLDSQLQQLMQRTMAQRTHIPVPQQQPAQQTPYMQGPATTHAEGNQMFFHNLGALIGNAAQAAKQNQIKQATGVLQQLSNAHDKYQEMVISQGVTDPAEIQRKTVQLMGQAPEVQEILSDKKKMKQLQKLGQLDLFNPDAKQDVVHEAAKRVGKANKLQQAMRAMGQVIGLHRQQQQLRPPEQILSQLESRAQLASSAQSDKLAMTTAIQELREKIASAKNASEADRWKAQLDEKQKELSEKTTEFQQKLAEDKAKSDAALIQKQKEFDLKTRAEQDRVNIANSRTQMMKDRLEIQKGMADGSLPTQDIKTRGQLARQLLNKMDESKIESQVDAMADKLGPGVGTISDLLYQKGGFANPEYTTLRTDMKLIGSGLGRAHLGGRVGGTAALKYFTDMFGNTNASPENIKAALAATRETLQGYADAVPQFTGKPGGAAPAVPAGSRPPGW